MSDVNNQEIKELLMGLTQQVGGLTQEFQTLNIRVSRLEEHYYTLDKKMDAQYVALDKRIDALDKTMEVGFTALKGDIKRIEETYTTKTDALLKRVDN